MEFNEGNSTVHCTMHINRHLYFRETLSWRFEIWYTDRVQRVIFDSAWLGVLSVVVHCARAMHVFHTYMVYDFGPPPTTNSWRTVSIKFPISGNFVHSIHQFFILLICAYLLLLKRLHFTQEHVHISFDSRVIRHWDCSAWISLSLHSRVFKWNKSSFTTVATSN